jgi:hypothetical protein
MKGRWESSQQRLISNCLPHVFFFYLLAEAASDRLAFILVCERVCVCQRRCCCITTLFRCPGSATVGERQSRVDP